MILTLNGPMTRVERFGLAVGLALAALLMWPVREYVTDDTYIHLQYATHLAHGQGLVFNVGERVYGCTSPLWVTLIADGGVDDGGTGARLLTTEEFCRSCHDGSLLPLPPFHGERMKEYFQWVLLDRPDGARSSVTVSPVVLTFVTRNTQLALSLIV